MHLNLLNHAIDFHSTVFFSFPKTLVFFFASAQTRDVKIRLDWCAAALALVSTRINYEAAYEHMTGTENKGRTENVTTAWTENNHVSMNAEGAFFVFFRFFLFFFDAGFVLLQRPVQSSAVKPR